MPPTPTTDRQFLRHAESSPSLTSCFSPSRDTNDGMLRPVTHNGAPSCNGRVLHGLDEDDYHLDSRESMRMNDRGYPDGPIQIYDSGVFLYLEPTADEASKFDVVMNVAKEIPNPFTHTRPGEGVDMGAWRGAFTCSSTQQPSEGPEYLHVGWDHNSEILDDLQPLCDLIDSRVSQGKKVLVHCQLGVSRSASLVIAYGLYKNRDMDFNTMYSIVKDRSCWVGPNMSLIYQLTEFRSRLQRMENAAPSPAAEQSDKSSMRSSEPQTPSQQPEVSTPEVSTRPSSQDWSTKNRLAIGNNNLVTPAGKRRLPPRPLSFRGGFHSVDSLRGAFGVHPGSRRTGYGGFSPAKRQLVLRSMPARTSLFSPRTLEFTALPFSRPIVGDLEGTVNPKCVERGEDTADPRSPPQGTGRVITRNIDEVL